MSAEYIDNHAISEKHPLTSTYMNKIQYQYSKEKLASEKRISYISRVFYLPKQSNKGTADKKISTNFILTSNSINNKREKNNVKNHHLNNITLLIRNWKIYWMISR